MRRALHFYLQNSESEASSGECPYPSAPWTSPSLTNATITSPNSERPTLQAGSNTEHFTPAKPSTGAKGAFPFSYHLWLSDSLLSDLSALKDEQEAVLSILRSYHFSQLSKGTGNFSEKNLLGSGGYGKVYKGILEQTVVAVKILNHLVLYLFIRHFYINFIIISLFVSKGSISCPSILKSVF
jgi:hypothetical protein